MNDSYGGEPGAPGEALRIEEAGLNALQTQRQFFYDGWLLRVSPGTAKRARSINPHFGSTLPLERKIAHCEGLYARLELPTLFRITPFAHPADLVPALAARGYASFDTTLVQTLALEEPPETPDLADDGIEVREVSAAEFTEAAGALRGSSPERRAAHLERLDSSPLVSRLVVVLAGNAVVCTAQLAAEDDLAGVFDVITAPDARGRGHATRAVGALLAWAWDHAMRLVYLQVTASNAPAVAVYRKFGFRTLYTYCYYGRPGEMG